MKTGPNLYGLFLTNPRNREIGAIGKRKKIKANKAYFKNSIGIIAPEGLPPTIKLAVQKTQAQYLITRPWHDSQNIVEENEEQVVFSFKVHPTYEFRSLVLSLGKDAYIQEPTSLREEMKKELEKMLGYY